MPDQKTIDQFIREHRALHIAVSTATRTTDDSDWEHDAYRVKLTYQGRQMTLNYRKGVGHQGNPPQLDEILDSIRSEDPCEETFEDWAPSLGYDTDSRKAYATYQACVKQAKQAKALLGADSYAVLLDCEGL